MPNVLLSNSLNTFFKEMYGDQFGEFVLVYCGLTLYVPVVTKINFLLTISIQCPEISYEN